MTIAWRMDGAIPIIFLDEQHAVTLAAPAGDTIGLQQDHQPVTLRVQEHSTERIVWVDAAGRWTVHDTVQMLPGDLLHIIRTWHNRTAVDHSVTLFFELYRDGDDINYLIPAVSYDGNQWGNGLEPKGLFDRDAADNAYWVYGGDRTSLPAATLTEGAGFAVGLYTSEALANQSACALRPTEGGLAQQIRWPLQELPRSYVRRDTYGPAIDTDLIIPAGGSHSREVFIAIQPAECHSQDYHAILTRAWEQFSPRRSPAPYSPTRLWQLGIQYAKEHLWCESESYTGFMLGRMLTDGQWLPSTWNLAEIGWCGQNGTLACMMLQDFLWHGDEDSWRRGASALDFWIECCRLPTGLFYTHIEHALAGASDARLETCNLGGGVYAYLLAAELAERAGRPQPHWREMALGACDFFTRSMRNDGCFGRYWAVDGQLLEAEGTVGSWMIWPLLYAYRQTHNTAYLEAAQRGFRYYSERDLAQFCITAGALDTDCIDKEGAFPLLMSGLDLYQISGDAAYLAQAERAADYLATWQWHYSLSYLPGTAAQQIGYDTFGGTSVSVQHHHLDPWGALIALGWLRLGQLTGKQSWTERGTAAWRQGAYGVSDGCLTIDGVTRPAGGQDEGFMHTRWGKSIGGVSDWLVAWPTAFRLFTLAQWPEWKLLE